MIKPIPICPIYLIDDSGNVFRERNGKLVARKTYIDNNGYRRVVLHKNHKRIDKSIAFLVALTFIPGYKEGMEVNHINKNRLDNRVENLEWMTRKDNVVYSIGERLVVTTKSGFELVYESISDFAKDVGIPNNNLCTYYLKKQNGLI